MRIKRFGAIVVGVGFGYLVLALPPLRFVEEIPLVVHEGAAGGEGQQECEETHGDSAVYVVLLTSALRADGRVGESK